LGLDGLGGPRTETKFTKWSVSLKRLRTAGIECAVSKDYTATEQTKVHEVRA